MSMPIPRRPRVVLHAAVCLLASGLASPSPGFAQSNGDAAGAATARPEPAPSDRRSDVDVLRDEVAELRAQMTALASELRALRLQAASGTAAPAEHQTGPAVTADAPAAAQIPPEMLQAQIAELAQTKVQSGSRFPVTVTGTILSNTVFNSGDANWLENPNLVGTATGGSMTTTMRQSRLGFDVRAIPIGAWEAKGTLIMDFFGGTPGFVTGTVMGLPRLLYAFGRLEHGGTAIQVGQDQALLAPRDPTSLAAYAFPQFFRSGNLYLRAPQVRLEQRLGGGWTAQAGIVAPVAGDADPSYVFAPTAGAGERSQRPAVQAHLGWGRGTADGPAEAQIGVSGHQGWIKQAGQRIASSAGAVDFNLRRGRLGMAGEIYAADELDAYGAGVAQPGRSEGGWIEGRIAAATRVSFNGGAAVDRRPDGPGTGGRLRNRSAFGNVIVRLTPEVAASVEYRWLQTRYASGNDRGNHHVNAVFAVTF
ncbi:MAG: hypothetical protein AB7O28_06645 [Vicinamibacterales bacterium]